MNSFVAAVAMIVILGLLAVVLLLPALGKTADCFNQMANTDLGTKVECSQERPTEEPLYIQQ